MTTPQQFLESFLHERAKAYAEANTRLAPVHTKYFGEPLLQHARDFLLRDRVEQVFDEVKQSAASAIVTTREHFRAGDIRMRYHLSAVRESWNIVRIERECFLCRGTGRSEGTACEKCGGEGWYDPREITSSNPALALDGGIPSL